MAVDYQTIEEFIQSTPARRDVAFVVRGAGFEITRYEETDRNVWGFYLKPNRPLRDLFGTVREILLWASEHPSFQARTVEQAQREIDDNQPRLSDEFCIVIVQRDEARDEIREAAASLLPEYIGLSFSDLRRCHPIGKDSFTALIQSQLFSRDLYRVSTALTKPRGFYGRQSILADVVSVLRTGRSNVGIFGLRKMGKTSLLYRILETLRTTGRAFIAHVDLERLEINPSLGYSLWSIGEALVDSNSLVRKLPEYRLFGSNPVYSDIPDKNIVPELFDHDLRLLLSKTNRQVIFLLDEIERMCPLLPDSPWGDTYVKFWRLLRGLHQQFPGRLGYLITGTNPKCVEMNKIGSQENPAYNYFDVRYLPALTLGDSAELLQQLGRPMGLAWSDQAIRSIFDMVGGHPFLVRALASMVHKSLLPRSSKVDVTTDQVTNQTNAFLSEFNATLTQMIEVLGDYYKDELLLLETLSSGRLGEFRELAEAFPQDVAHLRGYGLLNRDEQHPTISVAVLQTWLQRRSRSARQGRGHEAAEAFRPGDQIDTYQVVAEVGHSGGFARVYKARRDVSPDHGGYVAIKVFNSGLLSSLQREMDALDGVSHPNIVRFLEHGSYDGKLYLVMEFLDGPSMKSKCDRTNRLTARDSLTTLKALAGALVALHPNQQVVQNLRTKRELTPSELDELERARHGHVHRDIKPENIIIVEGRGPVLIDFNISSEVGAPVKTLQRTPGYLPPDGLPPRWSVDIDLYDLGVTMLQATLGIEYDGKNLDDLREMISSETHRSLADILLQLTAPTLRDRFSTAHDLERALARVKLG